MKLIKFETVLNDNKTIKLKIAKRTNIENNQCNDSEKVYQIMTKYLKAHKNTEEHMYLLCLDTRACLIGYFETAIGTVNSCLVGTRELIQKTLLANAVNVILVHNHPSGDPTPSKADLDIVNTTKKAFYLINVELFDTLIIGKEYYSMKEHGLV